MITLQRKFYPVGHGAFFVEKIYCKGGSMFTAVYDCGDSNDGHLVEKYAILAFGSPTEGPVQKIDALFISHFDSDHINGLKYLKPYMSNRTKVFLPFFYTNYQSLYNRNKREGIATIIAILDDLKITPILVRYAQSMESGIFDFDESQPRYDEEDGNYYPTIDSGTVITKKDHGYAIWKYVPFNLHNEQQLFARIKKEVLTLPGWSVAKLHDVKSWCDDTVAVRQLRRIYRDKLDYTINVNSLIVLSAPCFSDYMFLVDMQGDHLKDGYLVDCRHHYTPVLGSCLYTGDTVLKRSAGGNSKDIYESLLMRLAMHTKKIGLMQIPHHGSSNNINMASLVDGMSCSMFCNYGSNDVKNKTFYLTHTHLETVWKNVYCITEKTKGLEIYIRACLIY